MAGAPGAQAQVFSQVVPVSNPVINPSDLSKIGNDIADSQRTVGLKWKGKNKKYKMYKEFYKTMRKPGEEFTKEESKRDTAFVPAELKTIEKPGIGTGFVFPTSEQAREDKTRIQLGISARGVVSDPHDVYHESNIIVVSLKDADQYFDEMSIYPHLTPNEQNRIEKAAKSKQNANAVNYASFAAMLADDADAANALKAAVLAKISSSSKIDIPYLRGVTTFTPLLPPPKTKAMSDYVNDIKRFNLGSPKTAIQQALGQATYRAVFTVKQAALNQSFMLTESEFYRMSSKNDAAPMTTVKDPRVVMFNKKFLETDDAVQKTVPNGEAIYNSCGGASKADIESLMKVFLSSPTFGERFIANMGNASLAADPSINEAFQNLQIHEDVYEMIKHTLFATYVNLVTCIADLYIHGGHWEEFAPVGSFAGYPPGLIMPCHLYRMLSDDLFESILKDSVDLKEGPKNGETMRNELYNVEHPYFQSIYNLRKAFMTPFDSGNKTNNRLFVNGTEFLNSLTPNRTKLVLELNKESNDGFRNSSDAVEKLMTGHARTCPVNSSSITVLLSAEGIKGNIVAANDDKKYREVLLANKAIYAAIKPYIQQDLAPTGPQVFNLWKLNENNIMNEPSNGGTSRRPAQAKMNLNTFRANQTIANSSKGVVNPHRLRQSAYGNLRSNN